MVIKVGSDHLHTRRSLNFDGQSIDYYSIAAAESAGVGDCSRLPACLAVLLENILRFEDGHSVRTDDALAFARWLANKGHTEHELAYRPARVLMQDFTGVPAVVDLAAMRDGMVALGGDARKINPLTPVDLVIDHSVMVDAFAHNGAFAYNVDREYERNSERYAFLKWGQSAFDNFRVVPPGTGICHQVNLEYLARTVWTDTDQNGVRIAYPDTVIGTDSHTTMINGLAVLGWGVGGIEAEAAMLGQPVSLLIPNVVGFELVGHMPEGTTATDLVLKVVKMLRDKGVVGKFVEFYGDGLDHLPLADRATIANMAPEYGATCGFFPVDKETLRYLHQTGRPQSVLSLVEAYAKENRLWRGDDYAPVYSDTLRLDMGTVGAAISGPKRPQDHVPLAQARSDFIQHMDKTFQRPLTKSVPVKEQDYALSSGDIVIAAITSCTNTSNPFVMVAAGLVARKARALGLFPKPWVKTSLAPGSQVVSAYLNDSGLQEDLDALGFNLVGYGCTTCIGNSGPLSEPIANAIMTGDLVAVAVLSGNRNFEGRVSPDARANYLASPPLVVAYALAGTMLTDLVNDALGQDAHGNSVYLRDIWPTHAEIANIVAATVTRDAFVRKYSNVFTGDSKWQSIRAPKQLTYDWPMHSTYVRNPPFFQDITPTAGDIEPITEARILMLLGDMITTDHISPAGAFRLETPAGQYLSERQIPQQAFNSYGARRGNHEVMMRGTFANIRIRNEVLDGREGGYALSPDGVETSVFEAAMAYKAAGVPLVVIGGAQYGAGSSRDWAAKGTRLLGIKAVIAESFERIHRSNLVGMGVIPFEFTGGDTRKSLAITGAEKVSITGLGNDVKPLSIVLATIAYTDGKTREIELKCRIDTEIEVEYIKHGGVLHYVLRNLMRDAA